ncbi:caspase-1-like [Anopheles marshallii]|uniref:caspase-1-like n=1 Tax=Anopheles marshallii TaxID=1521116 RepID=UPI00237AF62B|nr:caspase-1-like [Anopheles marshallii]
MDTGNMETDQLESSQSLIEPTSQFDSRSINLTITTSALDAPTAPSPVSRSVAVEIDDRYDTSHPNRGLAIIINQVKFNGMAEREGSDKDRDSISSVLSEIGFDVREIEDLKKRKLLAMLKSIASEDHSKNDCLVVVVMTHGKKNNRLYARDKCYKADKLWEPFIGDACPSLLGKPKLFFIQACRGKKLDTGSRIKRMVAEVLPLPVAEPVPINYVIPTMADLLVMYSTCDGYYAWRNTDNGSWFIQSLSMELVVKAHRQELLHILTGVSRRVAYQYQSNVPGNRALDAMKQMPCIKSMLTKLLYFPSQNCKPDRSPMAVAECPATS